MASGKNKIDIVRAFKLRTQNKLTMREIADRFGCHKSSISKALRRFIATLPNPEEIQAYLNNRSQLLTGMEFKLLREMADESKLKVASVNNLAYAFQNINNANRLENNKSTINASVHISAEHKEIAQRVVDEIVANEVLKVQFQNK